MITLNNKLGLGISYERLQRHLTAQSEKVMHQVECDGVYDSSVVLADGSITDVPALSCHALHSQSKW